MWPLLWLVALAAAAPRCDLGPGDTVVGPRARPDGKFSIFLNGHPEVYEPGEMYTVTLKSLEPKFTWFSLWAEAGRGNTGTFHPFGDSITKSLGSCLALVTAASSLPKREASSMWSAPPPGSGCVTFKATVVVERDEWYQEDGPLSYTICEDPSQSNDEQPRVNHKCCACDEAKYEVGFEGLWSRQTHPKDFPEKNLTRFSDVIGASHTTEYRFWDYGGIASEGLREVAELGSTRTLESELKSQSENIRTIIKARGIAYPNVTSKTFAVFRVDSKHHLISLVSMIAPSPDWIVGVSGLELCLSNCSWVESKVLNLYPWDAGTDSGISYLSPKVKTEPRDHIRKISSLFPKDPRSPFYDPTGEPMKPLAKLYLTRQRLYEKVCENSPDAEAGEACETREWGEWSDCSVSCGIGYRTRQRFYRRERRAFEAGCQEELTSRVPCHAPEPCRWNPEERRENSRCQFTAWTEWSPCSVTCGRGFRYRFRRLEDRQRWKECMYVTRPPPTVQKDPCTGETRDCSKEAGGQNCTAGDWSEWSPCSVSCGRGVRVRQRQLQGECGQLHASQEIPCADQPHCAFSTQQAREYCLLPKPEGPCRGEFEKYYYNAETGTCTKFISGGCPLSRNQFDSVEDCENNCGFIKDELANASSEGLGNLENGNNVYYGAFGEMKPASYLGTMEPVTGVDGVVIDCKTSSWGEWGSCSVTCGQGYKVKTRRIIMNARNGGKACPRKLLKSRRCHAGACPGELAVEHLIGYPMEENNLSDEDDGPRNSRVECVYSNWTPWTPCSPSCGLNSIQQRTRMVDVRRSPRTCTDRMETRVCNVLPC